MKLYVPWWLGILLLPFTLTWVLFLVLAMLIDLSLRGLWLVGCAFYDEVKNAAR